MNARGAFYIIAAGMAAYQLFTHWDWTVIPVAIVATYFAAKFV